MKDLLDKVYEATEGDPALGRYCERHGVKSAAVLTVYDDEMTDKAMLLAYVDLMEKPDGSLTKAKGDKTA